MRKYQTHLVYFLFFLTALAYLQLNYVRVWDDYMYLVDIFLGRRSGLLLGRSGYIFPFHYLWQVLHHTFNLDFQQYIIIIKAINLALAAVVLCLLRYGIYEITQQKILSLFVTTTCLLHFGFLELASGVSGDVLMLASISVSACLYYLGHRHRQPRLIFLSAVVFAFGFLVREPTLYYGLFFLVPWVLNTPRLPTIVYLKAIGVFILTASLGPLFLFARDGFRFLKDFLWSLTNGHLSSPTPFGIKLTDMICHHLIWEIWLLPLFVGGFFICGWRFGWRRLITLTGCFLAPMILTVATTEAATMPDSRYFSAAIIWFQICVSIGIFESVRFGLQKLTQFFVHANIQTKILNYLALSSACLVSVGFLYFYNFTSQAHHHNHRYYFESKNRQTEDLVQRSKKIIRDRDVLLIGTEVPAIYLDTLARHLNVDVIWPGWGWPHERLSQVIQTYLQQNRRVVFNASSTWEDCCRNQIQKLPEQFHLIELGDGFFELRQRGPFESIKVASHLLSRQHELTPNLLQDDFPYALAFLDDDQLGWKFTANLQVDTIGMGYPIRYSFNHDGFRDQPWKKNSSYDVAIFGSNRVFGMAVDESEMWTKRLQKKLPSSIRLMNYGVLNYSLDQIYLNLQKQSEHFNWNEILVEVPTVESWEHSFIVRPYRWGKAKPYARINGERLQFYSPPFPRSQKAWADCSGLEYDFMDKLTRLIQFCWKLKNIEDWLEDHWEYRMVDRAADNTQKMLLNEINNWAQTKKTKLTFLALDAKVLAQLKELQLPYVDLAELGSADNWIDPTYNQLKASSHQKHADLMLERWYLQNNQAIFGKSAKKMPFYH